MVEETRTPKYCATCGVPLTPNADVQGFDPYTGDPLTDSRLECNNPTVQTRNRFLGYPTTTTTYHPGWVKTAEGNWQQF